METWWKHWWHTSRRSVTCGSGWYSSPISAFHCSHLPYACGPLRLLAMRTGCFCCSSMVHCCCGQGDHWQPCSVCRQSCPWTTSIAGWRSFLRDNDVLGNTSEWDASGTLLSCTIVLATPPYIPLTSMLFTTCRWLWHIKDSVEHFWPRYHGYRDALLHESGGSQAWRLQCKIWHLVSECWWDVWCGPAKQEKVHV